MAKQLTSFKKTLFANWFSNLAILFFGIFFLCVGLFDGEMEGLLKNLVIGFSLVLILAVPVGNWLYAWDKNRKHERLNR